MSNNINESKGIEKDEKLCPMCGETIKLIAIKCKYCESILCDRTEDDAVEDVYYYRYGSSKQTETGPFTYEEIKDLYAKDKISSSVFISKNNSNDQPVVPAQKQGGWWQSIRCFFLGLFGFACR